MKVELNDRALSILRLVAGLVLFGVALWIVTTRYRAELESTGEWFIDRFGIGGMAFGSFVADGLHFPVPPQFYLIAGIAGGASGVSAAASVMFGSVCGSLLAFWIGRRASRIEMFHRRIERPRKAIEALLERHGVWGLVITGLLPFSYSLVVATAGALRLPYRAWGVLALMRAPRLLVSYALVSLVWNA